MQDPDMVAGVDRDTDGRAEHPVVRQRLRPEWIDLEPGSHRLLRDDGAGDRTRTAVAGRQEQRERWHHRDGSRPDHRSPFRYATNTARASSSSRSSQTVAKSAGPQKSYVA